MENKFSSNAAKKFWTSQEEYPPYGDVIKKRRLHEAKYLTEYVWSNPDCKTMTEFGCGNGATINILQELTNIKEYNCYDISFELLSTINTDGKRGARVSTAVIDLTKAVAFKESDISTALGVFMFLNDDALSALLQKVNSPVLITRDPCYVEERKEINTFSEKLGKNYSAIYRTPNEYINLFKKAGFDNIDYQRAFPDEIESDFGTKQYFFTCQKN